MFSSEFVITALVVVLIPGTGAIFTVSTGLAHSFRRLVVDSPRVQQWIQRGFAGLGLNLAVAER